MLVDVLMRSSDFACIESVVDAAIKPAVRASIASKQEVVGVLALIIRAYVSIFV